MYYLFVLGVCDFAFCLKFLASYNFCARFIKLTFTLSLCYLHNYYAIFFVY